MNTSESKFADLENSLDSLFGSDDDLAFDLNDLDKAESAIENAWRILIVDDEPEIHNVTKLTLNYFEFDKRRLVFDSAYSGTEARTMLENDPGYALVLLDVVMEADDAGLQVVNHIREVLKNKYIRIVLRTGQPGAAPEDEVVTRYDIDDYKAKTELTSQKLVTTVVSALRAYRELQRVDQLVQQRTAELHKAHSDITDSIVAAKRIQTAILPSTDYISQFLPNFFVFYRPKDIVSGDFYWFAQYGAKSILANIDCTGHGVPGAIMSVFSYNLLNHVVHFQKILDPAGILNELDKTLRLYLNNESSNSDTTVHNGMDMSVIVIDHETSICETASANHLVLYVHQGEIQEITGDKMPIGESYHESKTFSTRTVNLAKGGRLYLFTDGITDQFGGDQGRKYSSKRLKEFLLRIQELPLSQQVVEIETEFLSWKRNFPQTDDICLIGIQPLG
jgi:serine phosphatase RsbU (regulator of sigma subunit)